MSTSSGQELVPVVQDEAQLMPMDVNGADQSVTETTAPRVEEPTEGSSAAGPSVRQSQEPAPEPVVVDQRIFVHAPQYHWHQEGGIDADARVAIEKLHKDTHDFAVATVKEVDSLSERIEGVSERIDATAAAVEQQMEMVLAAGQGAQQFQEIAHREMGQTRADLVEGLGRVTALESSVQEVREAQQSQDMSKDIMDMITAQLQTFEAQIDAKIRGWTASAVKGCQELEETLGGVQEQLCKGTRSLDGNSGPVGPIRDPRNGESHDYKMDGVQPYL